MSSRTRQTVEQIAGTAAQWVARRDAGLSTEESAEFAHWCAADPRHASAVEHYAATWSVLDRAGEGGAILDQLRVRVRRRRQQVAGMAAAVAVALTAAWQWRRHEATVTTETVAATAGVLRAPETRTLADGSVVELNRGAEIIVEFTPELRRVVLARGTGHFQVTKNPRRPFVVEVGGMQVRAVGTAFSVQREAQQFEVLVTEGRIAVEQPAVVAAAAGSVQAAAAPLASVGAGERVVVPVVAPAASAAPLAVVAVSPDEMAERLTWRARRVEFSDTPLDEAVALINRSGRRKDGVQIALDPESRALAREPVSGVFSADNAEAFVRVLELSFGVHSERRGNQIVVSRRD